jgi:hypothetical protein
MACWLVFAGACSMCSMVGGPGTGGGNRLGKQLDSLADMVTFGVAPALLLFAVSSPATFDNWLGANMVLPKRSARDDLLRRTV